MILNNLLCNYIYYNFSETCQKGLGMNAVKKVYRSVATYEKRKYWKESFFYDEKHRIHYLNTLKEQEIDVYGSVNEFSMAKRSEATIVKLNKLMCDLDCHEGGFNEWVTLEVLRADFFGSQVPYPSEVVNSGRGLHLYWYLEDEGRESLAKWKTVQQIILNSLAPISEQTSCNVDFKCIDPARVLRVEGTWNTKSKSPCRLIEKTNLTYTLDDILECFYGVNLDDLKPFNSNPNKDTGNDKKTLTGAKNALNERGEWKDLKVKRTNGIVSVFNAYSLLTCRAADLRKLLELRGGDMEGMRDDFLTKYAWTIISKKDDLEKLERELHGINSLFKNPLKDKEVSYKAQYIFNKFNKEVIKGADTSQFTEFDRYWYRNTTIIRDLNITMDEQRHMLTIISKEEKNRRKNERQKKARRNEGGLTKKQQEKADLLALIEPLLEQGLSYRAIAKELNVTLGKVQRTLK